LLRIDPALLDQLLHPTLDPKAKKQVITRGLPASPGAACGKVVFTAEDAEATARNKEAVILVRIETSPEDIHGMHAARGILTARGGHDISCRRSCTRAWANAASLARATCAVDHGIAATAR